MEPKRVLRVITRLNIGGPSLQALLLSKELRPEFDTVLVAGHAPPHEGELTDPDVPVSRVPLVRPVRPVADFRAAIALRRIARRWKPDIVHTHHAKAGALVRLVVSSSTRPCVTVHTFHGHVLDGYFGPLARSAFILIERALARRTSALIAVSEETRDELLGLGIGRPDQWHVIPLGFNLQPFIDATDRSGRVRSQLGLSPHTPLVGVFGRLAPIKNHTTMIHAMADLPKVHLAIFGDGEMAESLANTAASLGVSARVHFMGWTRSMAEAISDMDVVALTSRNEGTPVSLIEASACAKPVVATDVGGVSAVVIHGRTGFLVPVDNAGRVASSIDLLLNDKGLRTRMGNEGRAHVRNHFSKERLVGDIKKLYSGLLLDG